MNENKSTASKTTGRAARSLFSNRWLIVVGAAVIILALLFLARGWIRMTLLPGTIDVAYSNSVERVYNKEMEKLQDPLALLGYGKGRPPNTDCHTVVANGVKTQVDCQYDIEAYQVISDTPEARQTLQANAEKLQSLLKANGWQGEYSNDGQPFTSLVKLVSSITAGIDYQPDAAYEKRIGDVRCFLQNYTAFSRPDPAAMSAHIYCSRTFNVLGQPSWN